MVCFSDCRLKVVEESGDVVKVSLIFRERRKGSNWREIMLSEVMTILEGRGTYALAVDGNTFIPEHFSNPGGENDFGWMVSIMLRAGLYYGELSKAEYIEAVKFHYDNYYQRIYRSKSKMCNDFYNRYFSKELRSIMPSYESMFYRYSAEIERDGKAICLKRGGERYGCYTDDWGRCRPLTEPVSYEWLIPVAEKMWVCFCLATDMYITKLVA